MRVRGFTVDDAHLFCTPEQIPREIDDCVDFAYQVLKTFGFDKIKYELSVKGSDTSKLYLGSDEQWEKAESALAAGLDARGIDYQRMEGEAAFYGPKIDFKIEDAIGRLWQLGTVQWDFNLPERFELEYIGEDNKPHRPVMVHRALFGSNQRIRREGCTGIARSRIACRSQRPQRQDWCKDSRCAVTKDSVHAGARRPGNARRYGRRARKKPR